jgi:predicted metal-dependent RNase
MGKKKNNVKIRFCGGNSQNVTGSMIHITTDNYNILLDCGLVQLEKTITLALNKNWDTSKIKAYAQSFTWRNIAKTTKSVYE